MLNYFFCSSFASKKKRANPHTKKTTPKRETKFKPDCSEIICPVNPGIESRIITVPNIIESVPIICLLIF